MPSLSTTSSPHSLTHSPFIAGSDRSREPSTSESTPLHSPPPPTSVLPASSKERWQAQPGVAKSTGTHPLLGHTWDFVPDLAEPVFEDEDALFEGALFPAADEPSATAFPKRTMAASPVDISLPPRLSSSQSPRNQTSNLTSALQEAGATGQQVPDLNNAQHMAVPDPGRLSVSGRHDSMSNMFGSSYYGSGARPISMKDRQRRESNAGGSFMGNGMSWGGISVGSLRDEYVHNCSCSNHSR